MHAGEVLSKKVIIGFKWCVHANFRCLDKFLSIFCSKSTTFSARHYVGPRWSLGALEKVEGAKTLPALLLNAHSGICWCTRLFSSLFCLRRAFKYAVRFHSLGL